MGVENALCKVFDADKIQNLLSNLKNEQVEIFIWKLLGDQKHLASISIETIRKVRGDFVISAHHGHEKKLNEIVAGSGSIDFYVPSSGTLFRAKLKHSEENRFYIELPSFFAQSERRQTLRAKVFEQGDFDLKFLKKIKTYKEFSQHFDKKCFDLSTGGFSFFISKAESSFFKIDDALPDVKLSTGNWAITVAGSVTRIIDVEPSETNGLRYKALLVSCAFKELNDIGRKQLEKLIFERIQDDLHVINS